MLSVPSPFLEPLLSLFEALYWRFLIATKTVTPTIGGANENHYPGCANVYLWDPWTLTCAPFVDGERSLNCWWDLGQPL